MSEHSSSESTRKKLHPLALASLVLGLIGLFTLGIIGGLFLAGAGAVLGHLALHDLKWGKREVAGKRIAQVGLCVSYLAMFVFPVIGLGAAFSLPAFKEFQKNQLAAKSDLSRRNAEKLYIACEQYARVNQGKYPQSWSELGGQFLPHGELSSLLASPYPLGEAESFELVPHERPILREAVSSVVVIQEKGPPMVEKVAIVYADGKVDMIENPNRL